MGRQYIIIINDTNSRILHREQILALCDFEYVI